MKIGVGIVGLGTISERHIDAIRKCENLELVAICHYKQEHLDKRAEKLGVEGRYTKAVCPIICGKKCSWILYHYQKHQSNELFPFA